MRAIVLIGDVRSQRRDVVGAQGEDRDGVIRSLHSQLKAAHQENAALKQLLTRGSLASSMFVEVTFEYDVVRLVGFATC